ncbi:MAG: HDOD domain-containing protein [Azonexus sp.]
MDSCNPSGDSDKSGHALSAQRFRMLEDIARELAGDVVFPTSFDAVLGLRKILQDPERSVQEISHALSLEPLISAKLINLANSHCHNGKTVVDLQSAIDVLGLKTVRSRAIAIVMAQLLRSKSMAEFSGMTNALWDHSIRSAAAARVIAANCTRLNPEEAMLAGMIHDLGAFYMLYRASQYEELRHRPDTIKFLIVHWHESIGASLLNALGLPEELILATEDHDHPRPPPLSPKTLRDVVYIANLLAGGHFEWLMQEQPKFLLDVEPLKMAFAHLKPEIDALAQEMRGSFS